MAAGSQSRPFSFRRRLVRLSILILAAYLGLTILIGLFQRRLIYYPVAALESLPSHWNLPYEDIRLRTTDGVELSAWFVPATDARGAAIFCHGNGGNISYWVGAVRYLHELGLDTLIFDYRGFGQSQGSPSEAGLYLDAEAAWRFLTETRGTPAGRIVLIGRSLGGGVATELATRVPPAGLVLESTFTSLVDVGRLHFPLLPVSWMLRDRFESVLKIGSITCPKLVIHGTEDGLLPLAMGRRLFDAAGEPKRFVETRAGHNDAGFEDRPDVAVEFAAFLDEVLPAAPAARDGDAEGNVPVEQ
ncbi:MAG: alpha/beta hydrolase [Planctomycetes bacterium]|nr:alpha/beta hydrolase [Planctomycetota bacterium]